MVVMQRALPSEDVCKAGLSAPSANVFETVEQAAPTVTCC